MPEKTALIIPVQTNTLLAFLLSSVGTGIGLLLAQ
jgi:hypothetical protein